MLKTVTHWIAAIDLAGSPRLSESSGLGEDYEGGGFGAGRIYAGGVYALCAKSYTRLEGG